MRKTPPKYAVNFLRWFCREDYLDEIEGDLTEIFTKQSDRSPGKAQLSFAWRVLKYFRPEFIKSFKLDQNLNPFDMFRHNFLITFRNFKRHRSSFLINLVGLSTGLACALIIYFWVNDELNVDKFNAKDQQIYQVLQNYPSPEGISTGEFTPGPLAPAMASELPEVEHAATVLAPEWFPGKGIISFGDKHLKANPQFVSKDYFQIFSCKVLQGNPNNPFPQKLDVLISDELALKLFGAMENLIGKIVEWNHYDLTNTYHISGVFEKFPGNATSQPDLIFNFEAFVDKRQGMLSWGNSDPFTYVLLKSGTDRSAFDEKIKGFIKLKDNNSKSTLAVRRFSDKYLNGNFENGHEAGGRIFYVQLLSIIGFFILAIACINFMNLSTAKASRRIKEVGVKKVVGANRTMLISQYLSESAILTFISLLLAFGIVYFLLPRFNLVSGKNLVIHFDPNLLISLCLFFLVTSIVAGSYPALYLSGFDAATILKGKLPTSLGELLARKGLVIFQFAVSVILIVAVVVVFRQMEYVQNKNLGYKKDNLVIFEMEGQNLDKLAVFRSEIKKIPGVINAGSFYHNLTGDHGNIALDWDGKVPEQHTDFANLEVGYDFIETMGIEFKEGHSFLQDLKPENQIVLNETAIKFMGLKDPLGKMIRFWGNERRIVGIAKDFNFESLHEEVKPCFFQVYPVMPNFIVRIQGGTESNTLQQIQKLYNSIAPGFPFDYKFLDENYQKLYAAEQRVSILSRYFAGIAILISCLGLFGLSAFTAERRLKEIGIRKIMGSTTFGIVWLLSGDFTKVIVVAIAGALPVSFFLTKNWLGGFAYHINLEWWFFAGAGTIALIIAWTTIALQTARAARTNPAQTLRTE